MLDLHFADPKNAHFVGVWHVWGYVNETRAAKHVCGGVSHAFDGEPDPTQEVSCHPGMKVNLTPQKRKATFAKPFAYKPAGYHAKLIGTYPTLDEANKALALWATRQ